MTAEQTEGPLLDSAAACVAELNRLHNRLAKLPSKWATKTAELHKIERTLAAEEAAAFLKSDATTATERKAQATDSLADSDLASEAARLRGEVEGLKRIYAVLDRQSSIVQSILSYHRQEGTYQ